LRFTTASNAVGSFRRTLSQTPPSTSVSPGATVLTRTAGSRRDDSDFM